jgi:[ribosomal protein S18]-alanine N-acetyltransferase
MDEAALEQPDPSRLRVTRISPDDVDAMLDWRYADEFSVYNLTHADRDALLDPANRYFAIRLGEDYLGYVCIGPEARVPGLASADGVDDFGVGFRPELIGRGFSSWLFPAVLALLEPELTGSSLRVVIHDWNRLAQSAARRAGFRGAGLVTNPAGTFVVMARTRVTATGGPGS